MEADKLEANVVRFVVALPLTGEKAHDESIIKASKDRSTATLPIVADVVILVIIVYPRRIMQFPLWIVVSLEAMLRNVYRPIK
eukprot:scaffold20555_cov144-Skeletonema_dohrnii-CCMP3373.AAC.1